MRFLSVPRESRALGHSRRFGRRLFSHLHKTPADTKNAQVEMWTHAEIWQKAVVLQKSWDKAKALK